MAGLDRADAQFLYSGNTLKGKIEQLKYKTRIEPMKDGSSFEVRITCTGGKEDAFVVIARTAGVVRRNVTIGRNTYSCRTEQDILAHLEANVAGASTDALTEAFLARMRTLEQQIKDLGYSVERKDERFPEGIDVIFTCTGGVRPALANLWIRKGISGCTFRLGEHDNACSGEKEVLVRLGMNLPSETIKRNATRMRDIVDFLRSQGLKATLAFVEEGGVKKAVRSVVTKDGSVVLILTASVHPSQRTTAVGPLVEGKPWEKAEPSFVETQTYLESFLLYLKRMVGVLA